MSDGEVLSKSLFPVLKPSNICQKSDGLAVTALRYLVTSCYQSPASKRRPTTSAFVRSYSWSYNGL